MAEKKRRKVTIKHLQRMKDRGEKIVALGVYDAPMAMIADELGFELLINGNAGPMSLLGHKTPMTVTFEEQLILTQAVNRTDPYAMVVGHLPYMTYHESKAQAIRSATRMVAEGGADVVKCEGNKHTAEIVAEIVRAGIPCMGHMGMQASRKAEQSGFGVKGRSAEEAAQIVEDSLAFAEAGVFAFIVEQICSELTRYLAETLPVPVIAAAGGGEGDGVYLVSGDAVGYCAIPLPANEGNFVDVRPLIEEGLTAYRDQSRAGAFPSEDLVQHMAEDEHKKFLDLVS